MPDSCRIFGSKESTQGNFDLAFTTILSPALCLEVDQHRRNQEMPSAFQLGLVSGLGWQDTRERGEWSQSIDSSGFLLRNHDGLAAFIN